MPHRPEPRSIVSSWRVCPPHQADRLQKVCLPLPLTVTPRQHPRRVAGTMLDVLSLDRRPPPAGRWGCSNLQKSELRFREGGTPLGSGRAGSQTQTPKAVCCMRNPRGVPEFSPVKFSRQSRPLQRLPSLSRSSPNGLLFLSLFMMLIYRRPGINITVNQARDGAIIGTITSSAPLSLEPETVLHPACHAGAGAPSYRGRGTFALVSFIIEIKSMFILPCQLGECKSRSILLEAGLRVEAKEVPSSPTLRTLVPSPLSLSPFNSHTGVRTHTHAHTCLRAIFFLLIEVRQKGFFCLSSSSPFFFPEKLGCYWLILCAYERVHKCACVCVCVFPGHYFSQLHPHNESKFNQVWKINSSSITFVNASACCQEQPGCWGPRAGLERQNNSRDQVLRLSWEHGFQPRSKVHISWCPCRTVRLELDI